MKETIQQLEQIIHKYFPLVQKLSDDQLDYRYAPGKWSRREELGHLVDSAQNNTRRFIEAQYQPEPPVIVYNQDEWVQCCGYADFPSAELKELWRLQNIQLLSILRNMPIEKYSNICHRREPHTLEWLAADYVKHLLYHLHRILQLEPLSYP